MISKLKAHTVAACILLTFTQTLNTASAAEYSKQQGNAHLQKRQAQHHHKSLPHQLPKLQLQKAKSQN